jgi:hypothetical protein
MAADASPILSDAVTSSVNKNLPPLVPLLDQPDKKINKIKLVKANSIAKTPQLY